MHDLDKLTYEVIGCALRIHSKLGPGLFESVYHKVMCWDLSRGHFVESKKPIGFEFEGHWFEAGFVPDLIIDRSLIVEIKSEKENNPIHQKQLLTYLRLTDLSVGLVLNFGALHLRDGIKRVLNNWYPNQSTPSLPSSPSYPSCENE